MNLIRLAPTRTDKVPNTSATAASSGSDINGGAVNLSQLFLRPTARLYSTSSAELFICSSSTPPGGGVHGLCGYYAALEALKGVLK